MSSGTLGVQKRVSSPRARVTGSCELYGFENGPCVLLKIRKHSVTAEPYPLALVHSISLSVSLSPFRVILFV